MVVLVRVSIAVMKHHDQKQLEKELVLLILPGNKWSITEGIQGNNSSRAETYRQALMQRPWRSCLLTCFMACSMACSVSFLVSTQDRQPKEWHHSQ